MNQSIGPEMSSYMIPPEGSFDGASSSLGHRSFRSYLNKDSSVGLRDLPLPEGSSHWTGASKSLTRPTMGEKRKSDPIRMRRTESSKKLEESEHIAALRDYRMYARIMSGKQERVHRERQDLSRKVSQHHQSPKSPLDQSLLDILQPSRFLHDGNESRLSGAAARSAPMFGPSDGGLPFVRPLHRSQQASLESPSSLTISEQLAIAHRLAKNDSVSSPSTNQEEDQIDDEEEEEEEKDSSNEGDEIFDLEI